MATPSTIEPEKTGTPIDLWPSEVVDPVPFWPVAVDREQVAR